MSIDEWVNNLVAQAPALTTGQSDRITLLLREPIQPREGLR